MFRYIAVLLFLPIGPLLAQEVPPLPSLVDQMIEEVRAREGEERILHLDTSPDITSDLLPEQARARAEELSLSLGIPAVGLDELMECPPERSSVDECRLPSDVSVKTLGDPRRVGARVEIPFTLFRNGDDTPAARVVPIGLKAVFEQSDGGWQLAYVNVLRLY